MSAPPPRPPPSAGVPVKLFREAESHAVTVELTSGAVYRGTLEESEDSMSCLLRDVVHTGRDGRVVRLESVYLRGSQVRFVVLPEVLKGAPLFQCVDLGRCFMFCGAGGPRDARPPCCPARAGVRPCAPAPFSLSPRPRPTLPPSTIRHPARRKVRQFAEAKAKPIPSGRGRGRGRGRGGRGGRGGGGRVVLPATSACHRRARSTPRSAHAPCASSPSRCMHSPPHPAPSQQQSEGGPCIF